MEINLGILISALGTTLGAMPALLFSNVTHRIKDNLLAYSAGIMVAASTYALIPSTLKLSNMFVLVIGIFLGITTLTLLEISLPHLEMDHSVHSNQKTRPLLLIAAMAIHNIPEGFLVCLFLITNQIPKVQAFLYTAFTAGIELVSSFIGLQVSDQYLDIIPYGLAFAAGSMLFVVYKELIPESHGDGNERSATFSFVFGLLTMIFITDI